MNGHPVVQVGLWSQLYAPRTYLPLQRLLGATLLVFANKQDLPGALTAAEIKEVGKSQLSIFDFDFHESGIDFSTG